MPVLVCALYVYNTFYSCRSKKQIIDVLSLSSNSEIVVVVVVVAVAVLNQVKRIFFLPYIESK
jgi:hypothetical protein